ncbi:MAG: hypothetical protein IKU41_02715, partial [Clostridia bacterium]|nr:hypothetical protein [Clostridia bacterium]
GTVLSSDTARFIYDSWGALQGFILNDSKTYLYVKNLQGDIIAIVDELGEVIVEYSYDAWGNVTFHETSLQNMTKASTLCFVSPFTYRGYCYDYDIELYYLQSRYYSAEIGRFINTDDTQIAMETLGEILGVNLFAYCYNNPVNYLDTNGKSITAILIGVSIGALVGGLAGYALSRILKVPKENRWKYVLGGAAIGALIGGCIGYAVGAAGSSGIVLWSGGGVKGAGAHAANFAAKNGLRTLEMTTKGKLLSHLNSAAIKVLGKSKGYKFMKPLWNAASRQFVRSASGKQVYVNVFISVSQFSEASVFAQIEYQIVRSLGMKIIWHFVK